MGIAGISARTLLSLAELSLVLRLFLEGEVQTPPIPTAVSPGESGPGALSFPLATPGKRATLGDRDPANQQGP